MELKLKERFEADIIILNLTMGNAAKLMADSSFRSKTLQASPPRVVGEHSWFTQGGYFCGETSEGLHHQLVNDQPLGNGNSIFLSISPEWDKTRAPKIEEQLL